MSAYKYPFIPKEYYPAVMYACNCIRKYGTFNVAVRAAANKYGLDEDEIAKHVRKRQGAGQKGTTRKYKWYVVTGYMDEWVMYGDVNILRSQIESEYKPRRVCKVIKATNPENLKKQLPQGQLSRDMVLTGETLQDYDYTEYDTEKQAQTAMQGVVSYYENLKK